MVSEKTTLQQCREFYDNYGKEMIREEFADYESRIAVGLVGEGSECFGFDDEFSKDHDFAIGFCMWLTKADYEKIGKKLQEAYDKLLEKVGYPHVSMRKRRGVFEIEEFYSNILQMRMDTEALLKKNLWIYAQEECLATAVNGAVFRDDEGVFTEIRERILAFYPESVYLQKLAFFLHEFAGSGQSNYPRCMGRGDTVAAGLSVNRCIISAMKIAYFLEKTYPPYYKWTWQGVKKLSLPVGFVDTIRELSELPVQNRIWESLSYSSDKVFLEDPVVEKIEELAAMLKNIMCQKGLITDKGVFLETYVEELLKKAMECGEK